MEEEHDHGMAVHGEGPRSVGVVVIIFFFVVVGASAQSRSWWD